MIQDAFTDLKQRAASDPAAAGEFWKAVFESPQWHFINEIPADGAKPDGPPPFGWPKPMAARVEGKLFIIAFTSSERALDAARHNELIDPRFGVRLLEMPRDGAVQMLCQMNAGTIDGVLFNHNAGEQGFFAPLGNVATMYEWYLDRVPNGFFDAFVKGVVASNSRAGWQRLHRRVALMDRLWFAGDRDRPQAPQLYVHEGNPALLVFTDEEHVAQGAGLAGCADAEGKVPLIPTTPPDAAEFAEKLEAHSGGKVQELLFNLGSEPFIFPINGFKEMVEQYRTQHRPSE